jgi:hypothetical protein
MLAVEEPSVGLVEVRGVADVRRNDSILASHAVDLNRELDGNGELLELAGEVPHRGPAEALAVEDEAAASGLPHELERDGPAPILERLGEETSAAELESELPDALRLVIPGVIDMARGICGDKSAIPQPA